MKAIIEIDMDNAAFEAEQGPEELARILGQLAHRLVGNRIFQPEYDVELRDVNGNKVGTFRIEQ